MVLEKYKNFITVFIIESFVCHVLIYLFLFNNMNSLDYIALKGRMNNLMT